VYLLYVDDSGLPADPRCRHCVLAGYAIREDKTFWMQQEIDALIATHLGRNDIELHGSPMRVGTGAWRGIPKDSREELFLAVLRYIAAHYAKDVILFGVVLDKANPPGVPLSEELFTQITSRFDMFLQRKFQKKRERARGIAVFDKSKSEDQFQTWSRVFQRAGNHWGNPLRTFAEVPLFLNSEMSRHIQLADLIAYALFRKFEFGDDTYYSIISHCFDKDGLNIHGLYVR
jgi:hypothetical protein